MSIWGTPTQGWCCGCTRTSCRRVRSAHGTPSTRLSVWIDAALPFDEWATTCEVVAHSSNGRSRRLGQRAPNHSLHDVNTLFFLVGAPEENDLPLPHPLFKEGVDLDRPVDHISLVQSSRLD
ncbi:hypothetical protein GPN2_22187 [Streptomyces murinus]